MPAERWRTVSGIERYVRDRARSLRGEAACFKRSATQRATKTGRQATSPEVIASLRWAAAALEAAAQQLEQQLERRGVEKQIAQWDALSAVS